jgi:tetratricopeptide repeat protein/DUF2914 family protein
VIYTSTVEQILDSAARAASSEDYASAESLLREAARRQESSLGSQHPDLASTFNNLAVVCEKTSNFAAAREFYERAFSIASASLDSEHPLVITSRDNLKEFQRVHGAPPPAPDPRLTMGIAAIGAIVLLGAPALWFIATPSRPGTVQERSSEGPEPVRAKSTPAHPVERPVPQAPPSDTPTRTVAPASTSLKVRLKPDPTDPGVVRLKPDPTDPGVVRLKPDPTEPRVVEASLCESLSTTGGQWECTAASDPVVAGSLYFYTRIASTTSTRVHHRWYLNGRLRQDVDLAIQANPAAGYRTYSRQRLDSGDWRVEAVTAEGVVLHEARVAIR